MAKQPPLQLDWANFSTCASIEIIIPHPLGNVVRLQSVVFLIWTPHNHVSPQSDPWKCQNLESVSSCRTWTLGKQQDMTRFQPESWRNWRMTWARPLLPSSTSPLTLVYSLAPGRTHGSHPSSRQEHVMTCQLPPCVPHVHDLQGIRTYHMLPCTWPLGRTPDPVWRKPRVPPETLLQNTTPADNTCPTEAPQLLASSGHRNLRLQQGARHCAA